MEGNGKVKEGRGKGKRKKRKKKRKGGEKKGNREEVGKVNSSRRNMTKSKIKMLQLQCTELDL